MEVLGSYLGRMPLFCHFRGFHQILKQTTAPFLPSFLPSFAAEWLSTAASHPELLIWNLGSKAGYSD
jgi:hypothetical protein